MFEMFLQNKLKADSDTARSYTRFISVLKQVDQQLPADAPVRKDTDWNEVMNYALVRQIRMIDMNKRPRTAHQIGHRRRSRAGSAPDTTRPGPPWKKRP